MNFIETSPSLKKLVRPGRLVGHSEMTDQQDKEVIQDLRDGKVNLLVATDVAQEGQFSHWEEHSGAEQPRIEM